MSGIEKLDAFDALAPHYFEQIFDVAVQSLLQEQILKGECAALPNDPQCLFDQVSLVVGVAHFMKDQIAYYSIEGCRFKR
jgi:hypothetical protein